MNTHGKKKTLNRALRAYKEQLTTFTEDVEQGLASLKRVNDYGPCLGALEFKHALNDLDEEVSELAQQTQHLERFTVDSLCMEELLGHCSQLYQSNRAGMQHLQEHLVQYGYQNPKPMHQPRDPLMLVRVVSSPDQAAGLPGGGDEGRTNLKARLARQHRTPPLTGTTSGNARQRARQQTPGIQLKDLLTSDEDEEDMDVAEVSFKHQLPQGQAREEANPGGTSRRTYMYSPQPPATAPRDTLNSRHSLASSDSSTPEAFMSPSLAALQAKYAADAQAAQGTHKDQMPEASTMARSPQHGQMPGDSNAAGAVLRHGNRAGPSPPVEDDTCSLYQQLIRSKDVPCSITAALNNNNNTKDPTPGINSNNSNNRAALAAAATVANAGAGQASAESGAGGPGQQQQQVPQHPPTPPSRLLCSPSTSRSMTASRNEPLAAKLASLETMWVATGQAARSPTPKRAQSARGAVSAWDDDAAPAAHPEVSREAQAMARRMSENLISGTRDTHNAAASSSMGSTLMNGPVHKPSYKQGTADFEFAQVQPPSLTQRATQSKSSVSHQATPAWPQHPSSSTSSLPTANSGGSSAGHSVGGAGHGAAPNSSESSTHITPALDASLLSKYASATPSLSNLSPGTSSLLSRVFGTGRANSGKSGPTLVSSSSEGRPNPNPLLQQQPPLTATQSTSSSHQHQAPTSTQQSAAPSFHQQLSAPSNLAPTASTQQHHQSAQVPPPIIPANASLSSATRSSRSLASHPLEHATLFGAGGSCNTSGALAADIGGKEGLAAGAAAVAPLLTAVAADAYATLPMFLRTQLPLEQVNTTIEGLNKLGQQGHSDRAVTMAELEGLGLDMHRSKVFVNALCKLGKIQMQGASRFLCVPS